MKKLIIIGIDGMDREYINKNLNSLPTFKSIKEKENEFLSHSVFPPDSDTAWATIYTGLDPSEHGLVDFVDPINRYKTNFKESEYSNLKYFKNNTFWDKLSENGYRVGALFPHMAYPLWNLNGFMINYNNVGEIEFSGNLRGKYEKKYKIPILKRLPRTKHEYKSYLLKKTEILINEFRIFNKIIENEEFDLLFFYSSALDTLMHLFWNYCDVDDPTYPGENIFQDTILNLHKIYDTKIAEILNSINSDTSVIILSDHGHFRRPTKIFNINEILHKHGYIKSKGGKLLDINTKKEKIKRMIVDIVQKTGLRPAAQTFLRVFPKIKSYYTKPSNINFEETLAHCTDLSGMKAYNYGGIRVYKNKFINEYEYENAINEIITILSKITIPDSSECVFDWICRREKVYNGRFIEKYPEIIFNLKEEYGAGWQINSNIWDVSIAHKFFPGSHRASTPIFYILNMGSISQCRKITLEDVFPTVLKHFNIINDSLGGGSSII